MLARESAGFVRKAHFVGEAGRRYSPEPDICSTCCGYRAPEVQWLAGRVARSRLGGRGPQVRPGGDDVPNVRHGVLNGHAIALRPVPVPERHRTVRHVLVTRYGHEGNLLVL